MKLPPAEVEVMKAEFERACSFGRSALQKIPRSMPDEEALPDLGKRPDVTDGALREIFLGSTKRWSRIVGIGRNSVVGERMRTTRL